MASNNTTGRIRLNVGGKIFETTSTTLTNAGCNSMLGALLDDNWNVTNNSPPINEYFIDRNPKTFSILLDLLRTGELHIPSNVNEKQLFREAMYYGIVDHVRAAKWGPFDGNCVRLAGSISGRAPGDGTAVRAAPDGGCCVVHGSMVHVYDWMLEELRPISLDYQRINDVGYIDSHSIVVTAGGMGLFSSSTGDVRHRFKVSHENQFETFAARALTFSNQESKIFASCRGRFNEHGIGVWDQITGNQSDFFYEPPSCSLGNADKLQWLDGKNCLMVATLLPRADSFLGLLDFREKGVVWSWSDKGTMLSDLEDKRVLHAIAMDDNHTICVVNQHDDLGFLDIRNNGHRVRWSSSRNRLMKRRVMDESCYPKLVMNNGQLFLSMNDSISVFCGPEWVLTSNLRRSYGGSIRDFSVGGDRLFALHGEENVFDVWETLPSPMN